MYYFSKLVRLIHLKQWLAIVYGKLPQHRAGLKDIAVEGDVVAEYLLKNAPILKPLVKHLVMCPRPALHC